MKTIRAWTENTYFLLKSLQKRYSPRDTIPLKEYFLVPLARFSDLLDFSAHEFLVSLPSVRPILYLSLLKPWVIEQFQRCPVRSENLKKIKSGISAKTSFEIILMVARSAKRLFDYSYWVLNPTRILYNTYSIHFLFCVIEFFVNYLFHATGAWSAGSKIRFRNFRRYSPTK